MDIHSFNWNGYIFKIHKKSNDKYVTYPQDLLKIGIKIKVGLEEAISSNQAKEIALARLEKYGINKLRGALLKYLVGEV